MFSIPPNTILPLQHWEWGRKGREEGEKREWDRREKGGKTKGEKGRG
jgi:hypothetical protein